MPRKNALRRTGKDKAIERAQRGGKYTAKSVRIKAAKAESSASKRCAAPPDPPSGKAKPQATQP